MKMLIVKIADVKEDFNPRSNFNGVVDELVKSISAVGLLQPIVVRQDGEKIILVDGACRLRALKKLEQKETQAIVIEAKSADEAQMAANLMRSDLNILERARGYERMIRLFPKKYNTAGIGKMFGESEKMVKRLVSVAQKIPANFDAKIGAMNGLEFEAIEMLAQIPNDGTMDKVIESMTINNPNIFAALQKVAHQLDYSCDALTTGKLISSGKAFVIKGRHGNESAYTTDAAAFKEAKDAYEAKQKKQYGQEDKKGREKVKEKSEKQKNAERAARKKEKEARMEAVKALPGLFKRFIAKAATADEIHAAAKELFENHTDSDKCRRLWAAFGIKGCDKISSYELRGKTFEKVILPNIDATSPDVVARILAFTKMGWKDGATPEQAWVAGMKK